MTNPVNRYLLILAATLGLVAVGCGSQPPSPGATIKGTAVGASALSSGSPGERIKVTALEHSRSAETDASGHFELHQVGPGRVTLRFEASGIDARLELRGLLPGQILELSVEVSGSTVSFVVRATVQAGAEVEITGPVESIAAPNLTVAGRLVQTTANTEVKRDRSRIALADLRIGEIVKVEGMLQADGSLLARQIRALGNPATEPPPGPNDLELTGAIEAISPPNLTVGGKSVATDASTEISRDGARIALTDLRVGEIVKVEGTLQADGSVLAREIETRANPANPPPSVPPEAELLGMIEALAAPNLTVAGKVVVTNASTEFKRGEDHIAFADLRLGETVKVEGTLQADGSVLAREIKAAAAPGSMTGTEVRFMGRIEEITPPTLKVAGRIVMTSASTEIRRHGQDIPLSQLAVGTSVEVEGLLQADGSVQAQRIRLED
jgi:hypothetical protein